MPRNQSFLALILLMLLSACAEPSPTFLPTFTPRALTNTPPPTTDWQELLTPNPVSVELTVDPVDVNLGDTVSVSWVTHGAEGDGWRMQLWLVGAQAVAGANQSWLDLPLNGSLNVQIDGVERQRFRFILHLSNFDLNLSAGDEGYVRYPCPETFFFGEWRPNICPAGPAEHPQAAQQDFQGGRMIWLDSLNMVYVMISDGSLELYPNTWEVGDPETDPTIIPPANGYQPGRELGKVWRENASVRKALGWALAPEQQFTSTFQSEYITGHTAGGAPIDFIQLAEGRTVGFLISYSHGGHPYWFYANP